ncbi:MAG: hypothetical protein VYC97_06225 [SAR324 cluster bacterium]|nr:hypothetical protein [SAR324 cluster bacterium]
MGASWAPLAWSEAPFRTILAPQDASGVDFGGFGGMPGWVVEGLGGMFWHAVRCASNFMTECFL